MNNRQISKTLAYILRHKPEDFDLKMDEFGWIVVEDLLKKLSISKEKLKNIVQTDSKGRYQYNLGEVKIRATQGHSIPVILDMVSVRQVFQPVYHGTSFLALGQIQLQGLLRGSRQHVHMSYDKESARKVGSRHGSPVVLEINVNQAIVDGLKFFKSDNGYILAEHVPAKYLKVVG